MSVRVARGAVGRIGRSPEFFLLQVRTNAADRATAALVQAANDIAALDGGEEFGGRRTPSFVSPVIPTPDGPLLQVDGAALPRRALSQIPTLVVRRLKEAGIDDAVVDCPDTGGPLDELGTWQQGAVLHLHPFPGEGGASGSIPPKWLETANAWVADTADASQRVAAEIGRFQFTVEPRALGSLLAMAERASADCLLVGGSADTHVHGVHLHHRLEPALLLADGGQAAGLEASAHALAEVGRQLAPDVAYAFISIEPTLAALRRGQPARERGRDDVAGLVRKLADEVALDAFWWQILTAGHLRRLGGPPPGAQPLAGEAVELAVGDVADWLPGSPTADAARAAGRALLSGVLIDAAEAARLLRAQRGGT